MKFWFTDQKDVNTVSDQRFKKLSFVSWWVNIKMVKEQVLNILFTIFANLFTILYSLKSLAHILQWWNLAQLYLTQRRCKKYMNHVTYPLSSTDINIFSPEISKFCYIKKHRYRLHFDTWFLFILTFPESL